MQFRTPKLSSSFLSLLLVVAQSTLLSAGDGWTEFRGSGAQGHADVKQVPLHWSATENVAWKQSIPGQGWSSPVILGNRIFLTTAIPENGDNTLNLHVLSINKKDGQVGWNTKVFAHDAGKAPRIHGKNTQASPTPIVSGNRIFVHFGHLGTACLDLNGKIIWTNSNLGYSPVHGNGGSPVLVGDRLIFSCDAGKDPFVVALAAKDGSQIWKVDRKTTAAKTFSFCTPLVIPSKQGPLVVSPGSGVVGAFDPKDGREVWRVLYGEGYSVVPRPVLSGDLLFIGTGFDRASVLAIQTGGNGDVTESHVRWKATRGAPNTPSMLVIGEQLYMVSDGGILTCLEVKTGKELWQERLGGNVSASPVYAAGRIYVQTEEGLGVVVKPGTAFEKLAVNTLGEKTLASYAVEEGAFYIRSANNLFRISDPK